MLEYKKTKKCIVYIHRNPLNGEVFYAGMGAYRKRAKDVRSRSKEWQVRKINHGFEYEIVAEKLSWEDACELESLIIMTYGRIDLGNGPLINKTNGGEGFFGGIAWNRGVSPSEETKLKISLANKGKKASEESKLKMSIAKKGIPTKPMTEINKKKLRDLYSKKVIDIATSEVFESAKNLSEQKNIGYANLCKKLNGSRNNNTNYRYL